jgi:hypothetical protein
VATALVKVGDVHKCPRRLLSIIGQDPIVSNIRPVPTEIYSVAWLCSILYSTCDMGLHYLTFMGRNLENKKKLALARLMNSHKEVTPLPS